MYLYKYNVLVGDCMNLVLLHFSSTVYVHPQGVEIFKYMQALLHFKVRKPVE
jgi:hypothetical protein